jgi:hypothetical protein
MEDSCECIEWAAAGKRQVVVLQLGLFVGLTSPHCKIQAYYEKVTRASVLDGKRSKGDLYMQSKSTHKWM